MSEAKILKFPQPPADILLLRFGSADQLSRQDLQAAYERGKEDGERTVSEQLIRQRGEVLEVQTGVLASLKKIFPQVAVDCERALVALALEVARKLVAGIPITTEMIESSIQEARAEMEAAAEHCVMLHPEDLEMLKRFNSPLLLPDGVEEKVKFRSSPQVSRGGCMIETKFGIIDARRETKLDQLKKVLQP